MNSEQSAALSLYFEPEEIIWITIIFILCCIKTVYIHLAQVMRAESESAHAKCQYDKQESYLILLKK